MSSKQQEVNLKDFLVIDNGNEIIYPFEIWTKTEYEIYVNRACSVGATPAVRVVTTFNKKDSFFSQPVTPDKEQEEDKKPLTRESLILSDEYLKTTLECIVVSNRSVILMRKELFEYLSQWRDELITSHQLTEAILEESVSQNSELYKIKLELEAETERLKAELKELKEATTKK